MPNRNQFHSKQHEEKPHPNSTEISTKTVEEKNKPKISSYFPDKKMKHESINIFK